MPAIKIQAWSILDLPEQKRTEVCARLGYTVEEFAAHQAGCVTQEMAIRVAIERGEIKRSSDFHYGDDWPRCPAGYY